MDKKPNEFWYNTGTMLSIVRHAFCLACVVQALLPAWAVRAPVSEAFARWVDEGAPSGGYRPSPVDASHLPAAYRAFAAKRAAGRPALRATAESALPSRWDSRECGWVTPVRDQGDYGTCWAYATLACLETAILKGTAGVETNSFSPNHMANQDVGFLWGFDDGGNGQMADALLTAWRDPLDEAQDPYPNTDAHVDLPAVCHVQNTVSLPPRANATDNETLKRAVMAYGALMVSYNASAGSEHPRTGAYYCSSTSASPNHAVTLVGWDDNYATNNFFKKPPGNGAFLVKNSWGKTAYGTTNGYTWISYYDTTFACASEPVYAYPRPESVLNYGRCYQYDPCGMIETYNVLESEDSEDQPYTNWCANVFSSVATGIVEAVGFYSVSPGTAYELRVYAALAGATPETGALVSSQTGLVAVAGFVTVPLATPVPVTRSGARFAVALALTAPDSDYPIPVEQSYPGYADCTANAGESFYSKDGMTWKDFQRFDKSANVCIKAYTRFGCDGPLTVDPLIAAVTPAETHLVLRSGESAAFAVETVASATDAAVAWLLDGRLAGTNETFVYEPLPADHGVHALVCQVRDAGRVDERTWSVSVAADVRVVDDAALAAAINGAVAGDRILVAPGTYAGQLNGPSVPALILAEEGPEKTFLVRTSGACCYYGGYNESAVLAGFTLKGGDCATGGGACYGVISNCVITGCFANYGGGAFGCTLVNCVIYDNEAVVGSQGGGEGGGVSDCLLDSCVISNCTAALGGGAAYAYVMNSLVVQNRAERQVYWSDGCGGGVYECILDGSTVAGNWAATFGGGAYLHVEGDACNSIVATNVCARGASNGHDVYGNAYWTMVATLSDRDAKFADAAHGNWRLAANSPAIDAGMNAFVSVTNDLDGAARIFGPRVDLGCYEYSHVPAGWVTPAVTADATPAQEAAAVAASLTTLGFPSSVAAHVTTVADYNRVAAWAEAKGVSVPALAASPLALLSPALGADGLLALAPEDLNATSLTLTTVADGACAAKMLISLKDYDEARCDPSLLKAAVGVVGASAPDATFSADALTPTVTPVRDGVEITVTPPPDAPAYFLKLTVR